MWLLKWANANRLTAAIFAVCAILALASAGDFLGARHAVSYYRNLAKGWAAAYQRDTAASKKEYEAKIKVLTADRDAYRKKWAAARGRMAAPWVPPEGAKALQERFTRLGYRGRLK